MYIVLYCLKISTDAQAKPNAESARRNATFGWHDPYLGLILYGFADLVGQLEWGLESRVCVCFLGRSLDPGLSARV